MIKDIPLLKGFDIKKNKWLLILLLSGIMIVLMGDLIFKETTKPEGTDSPDIQEVATAYENKLCDIVSRTRGAGKAKVMITLESGNEQIFAKSEKSDIQNSAKGTDISEKTSYSSEYVIIDKGSGQKTALVEKEILPAIMGIAVLCEGGDNPGVILSVTELVCVVMGVSSNRVFVGVLD